MQTTLSTQKVSAVLEQIDEAERMPSLRLRSHARRPVHVLYGGAHLFTKDTPKKLARLALAAFDTHAGELDSALAITNDALAQDVFARVRTKLTTNPIEALCIDFEDGFGERGAGDEDAYAVRAAQELAWLTGAEPIVGIRIKPLEGASAQRAVRTLDLFVSALAQALGPTLRAGFTVTLPKVSRTNQVKALDELLESLETGLGIRRGLIGIELMIETRGALVDDEGRIAIGALVNTARGRCRAVHLGAYDLTASLGVTASDQGLGHPFCDLARALLQVALAETDVSVFDGATTVLPLGAAIGEAWRLHAANVRRALASGIWSGWDLHPAQLPARYGALFGYFRAEHAKLGERLGSFVDRAMRASRINHVFDDAATAQGLIAFFRQGLACGALDDADIAPTKLSRVELESYAFADIVASRATAGS